MEPSGTGSTLNHKKYPHCDYGLSGAISHPTLDDTGPKVPGIPISANMPMVRLSWQPKCTLMIRQVTAVDDDVCYR